MLARRLRRRPNIEPTLFQCLVFAGINCSSDGSGKLKIVRTPHLKVTLIGRSHGTSAWLARLQHAKGSLKINVSHQLVIGLYHSRDNCIYATWVCCVDLPELPNGPSRWLDWSTQGIYGCIGQFDPFDTPIPSLMRHRLPRQCCASVASTTFAKRCIVLSCLWC